MTPTELLFYLIECAYKGKTPDLSNTTTTDGAVRIADKQGVLFYVKTALEKAGYILPGEYLKKYDSEIKKRELQAYYKEKVRTALVSAGVPFAYIKGDDIAGFLPVGVERFTSDIDFFYPEKHTKAVKKQMQSLGFTAEKGGAGAVDFHIEPKITFEGHFDLDCGFKGNPYADFSRFERTGGEYKMKPQDIYIYHIIHFANHFKIAGCGLRALADAYFLSKKIDTESGYVKDTLEKVGLTSFNDTVKKAACACFEGGSHDAYIKWFVKYLMTSGTYGTSVNRTKALAYGENGGKNRVLLKRAFPPYREMKIAYPSVGKFPPLLPFAWAWRLISVALFGRGTVKREMQNIDSVSGENLKQEREYYKNLGL